MTLVPAHVKESEIEKIWQLRDEKPRLALEKVQQLMPGLADEQIKARCLVILAVLVKTSSDTCTLSCVKNCQIIVIQLLKFSKMPRLIESLDRRLAITVFT